MKKKYYLILLSIVCVASCNTSRNNVGNKQNTSSYNTISNSIWKDSLDRIKGTIKSDLKEFIGDDWDFFKEDPTNVEFTEKDFLDSELIPFEVFTIDKVSFENLNYETPINNLVRVNTNKAVYLAAKDDKFLANTDVKLDDGNWRTVSYGGFAISLSNVLSELYFVKRFPVFMIGVDTQGNSLHNKQFLVYFDGENYMNLNIFGHSRPFIEALIEYRTYLKNTE